MNQTQLAVVVLLTKPERQHCIVPENCIFGLDKLQDDLKTWGVNRKCDHLVFWKRSFLDDNVLPDLQENPNFQLTPCDVFPPPAEIDSACYMARIKRFFSKYLYSSLIWSFKKRIVFKMKCGNLIFLPFLHRTRIF